MSNPREGERQAQMPRWRTHTLIQFASPEVGKELLYLTYLTVTLVLSSFADLGLPALREGADVAAPDIPSDASDTRRHGAGHGDATSAPMALVCAALGLQVGAAHRAALRGSGAAPALPGWPCPGWPVLLSGRLAPGGLKIQDDGVEDSRSSTLRHARPRA